MTNSTKHFFEKKLTKRTVFICGALYSFSSFDRMQLVFIRIVLIMTFFTAAHIFFDLVQFRFVLHYSRIFEQQIRMNACSLACLSMQL